MKKTYLSILSLVSMALVFGSCQRDELESEVVGGEVEVSLSAGLPSGLTTYGSSHMGGATNVNADEFDLRYTLEVYDGEEVVYEASSIVPENFASENASFSARLLAKKYKFVLWADFVTNGTQDDLYYNTADLRNISYTGKVDAAKLSDDAVDAYYKVVDVDLTTGGKQISGIKLQRPFGKIRFVATDALSNGVSQTETPASVKIDFKGASVPSSFNALTDEASGNLTVDAFTFIPAQEDAVVSGETKENAYILGYAYFFATEPASAHEVDVTVYSDPAASAQIGVRNLSKIPVAENKLTTVIGNFFTNEGGIDIIVEDEFGNEESIEVPDIIGVESLSLSEAQAELDKMVSDASGQIIEAPIVFTITEKAATTTDETFLLPEQVKDITLILTQGATNKIYFKAKDSEQFTGTLTIENEADPISIDINLPDGSAVVKGSFSDITATTADNTLVISEGANVTALTVNGGNVEVYGEVESITKKNASSVFTRHLSTTETFNAFAKSLNGNNGNTIYDKVVLDTDLDFSGKTIEKISRASNFILDGQNHKIANYSIESNTQSAGLFCDAITVSVSNLTLENAHVKAVNDGSGNAYAGALIGRSYGSIVLNNINVVNPIIEGINKVGGLLGFVAENDVTATGCSVSGGVVTTTNVEGESGQCGGLIGYLGNSATITDCSVTNTEINAYMMEAHRTVSKFIGCLQGFQATNTLTIDNCTVENVTLNGLNEMAASHVSIYGDLLGGQRGGNGTVTITNCDDAIYINNAGQLRNLASIANENDKGKILTKKTVKLTADIDLSGENWVPMNCFSAHNFVFDGQGHTINNMSAINNVNYGNGFFLNIVSSSVKNVTFDHAAVKRRDNAYTFSGNVYGIVSGYTYGNVLFENVHIKNSIIYGYGKVGGIVGMAADKGGVSRFVNCSVENTNIAGVYNVGGILGLTQNEVELSQTTTENVSWQKVSTETYIEVNTVIEGPDGESLTVNGVYWLYGNTPYYYAAWGDYYTDYYYADDDLDLLNGKLADGLCHNK